MSFTSFPFFLDQWNLFCVFASRFLDKLERTKWFWKYYDHDFLGPVKFSLILQMSIWTDLREK